MTAVGDNMNCSKGRDPGATPMNQSVDAGDRTLDERETRTDLQCHGIVFVVFSQLKSHTPACDAGAESLRRNTVLPALPVWLSEHVPGVKYKLEE